MSDNRYGNTVCITNRHLVPEERFLQQIERIVQLAPKAVILREKDLTAEEYRTLLRAVKPMFEGTETCLIAHTFITEAAREGVTSIHLPMQRFRTMTAGEREAFDRISVSTHSIEEIKEAEALGASAATISPIFETSCKPGAEPRGLSFLEQACNAVSIPVWALGGIREEQTESCLSAGADAVCMMSRCMEW